MAIRRSDRLSDRFGPFRFLAFSKTRSGETLDAAELVANGVDEDKAACADGKPDGNGYVSVLFNPKKALEPKQITIAASKPTEREITAWASRLEADKGFVASLKTELEARLKDGQKLSKKDLDSSLRLNAKAELVGEYHPLIDPTGPGARRLIERAMHRAQLEEELDRINRALAEAEAESQQEGQQGKLVEIAKAYVERCKTDKNRLEKELRKLDSKVGADVFIARNVAEGENLAESPLIPLFLAEKERWEFRKNVDGKVVRGTRDRYQLPRPKPRPGEPEDNALHGVCRAGLCVDGEYTTLVYYRMPHGKRRGVIVAIPMKLFKEMLALKYRELALKHFIEAELP